MKKIGIALIVALVAVMCFSTIALAADPTEVNIAWDGAGEIGATVTADDDATTTFLTSGSYIAGSFVATDQNDNPYGYGVDSFSTYLSASVTNGYIESQTDRTDSQTGSYGNAGQTSYTFVGVENGDADVAIGSTTNYAQMRDCTYGYGHQLAGGHNVVLGADAYTIIREMRAGNGDWAGLLINGGGSATLDCMSAEASGCWALRLGRGCGCYTDANFTAVGSGTFDVKGVGRNQVDLEGLGLTSYGDGTQGSASLELIANFASSFNIADYSVKVQ